MGDSGEYVSPYLLLPLRTEQEASADIARRNDRKLGFHDERGFLRFFAKLLAQIDRKPE